MFVLWLIAILPFMAAGYGLDVLTSVRSLTADDHIEVMMLKVVQLAQALGLFLVPYLVYRWIIKGPEYSLTELPYVSRLAPLIFAGSIFAAFPLINYLAEWNAGLTFPGEGLNEWIHQTEKDAEGIIKLFLAMDGIGDLLFNLFLIALLPAVSEELLFRGTFQPLLVKSFKGNYHIAIWVTAFLFSFLHLQFLGFFPRMLLGAILGYAAHWSGSLVLPMLGHFVNNGLAVMVAYYIGIDALEPSVENLGSDSSDIQLVATSAFMLFGGLWWIFKSSTFEDSAEIKNPSAEG